MLINTRLSTNSWTQLDFDSQDVTIVQIIGDHGTLRIINIYNDGKHNRTLEKLGTYLRSPEAKVVPKAPLQYIWTGDFNRHHPLWDEDRNTQLFDDDNLAMTQPLLNLLTRHHMKMALPKDIPTLKHFRTKNYTRPDNVFVSDGLLDAVVLCDIIPRFKPVTSDHYPIQTILNLTPETNTFVPHPEYRKTIWEEFSKALVEELAKLPNPDSYESTGDLQKAITDLDDAVHRCIAAHVPMSKPSPYSKRWWSPELATMKKEKEKLSQKSFRWKWIPEHPIHEEYWIARNKYSQALRDARVNHWREWLENLDESSIWAASRLVSSDATDGGRSRIPTLQIRDPITKAVLREATTNEDKSKWFFGDFYPKKPLVSAVPEFFRYPPPKWQYTPVTDEAIDRCIRKNKPYKGTRTGTIPNSVFTYNREALVPRLGPIYRSCDALGYHPADWKVQETLVLRKPGKTDYRDPGSWRPICLSEGWGRVQDGTKAEMLVMNAEKHGILPVNHFGGRPGRATTDSLHLLASTIKDAWQSQQVASLLLLDVKGAFPSVSIDMLIHNMRLRRVPKEYTDWLTEQMDGRTTVLKFDDYRSNPFIIDNGLDQGKPQSLICYLFYNAGLAEIPGAANGETGFLFVDDKALLAVGPDFEHTHRILTDVMTRPGGIHEWRDAHNCKFGLNKYQLLDLTRRRKPHPFRLKRTIPIPRFNITLEGHTIKSARTVKFLGVVWDRELRWKEQGGAAVAKGQDWLIQFGRLGKVTKGVVAKHLRQMYLAVAVPRMMYAADIWMAPPDRKHTTGEKDERRAITKKLASVQRRAALSITGAMITTPSDLIDAHANLLPMNLLIEKTRHRAAIRIATLPKTHPLHAPAQKAANRHRKTHTTPLHDLMHRFSINPKVIEKIAAVRVAPGWKSKVEVRIAETREEAKEEDAGDEAEVKVYTDGSGIEGMIGAAAVLYRGGREKRKLRYQLGTVETHTVYEGEGIGMLMGLHLISQETGLYRSTITMGVDNNAAILATGLVRPAPSHYIWDAIHSSIESISRQNGLRLRVRWTPGHIGIEGNERADVEAKKAAENGSSAIARLPKFLHKTLPHSSSAIKQAFNKALAARARLHWTRSQSYPRIQHIDSSLPSRKYLQLIEPLPRKHAALLIQLRSGHVPLAKHLHRFNKADSPICPCCHRHEEDVHHYILRCPAPDGAHRAMHREGGSGTRSIGKLLNTQKLLPHLFRFVGRTERFRTVFGDIAEFELPV